MTKKLPPKDTEVTHVKGSGPGGQNRNKRMSGVRVVHKPTGLVVRSTERRSQGQNLRNAFERLEEKIEQYYYTPEKRVATQRTASSKKRRLKEKTHRSDHKKRRRKISRHDADE